MKPYEINSAVAEQLKVAGDTVMQTVISRLAGAEIEKRAVAMQKAVEMAARTHAKIKQLANPTIKTFNIDGSIASASFSAEQIKESKRLTEKATKIEKAFEKATSNPPDYSDLYNLKDDDNGATGKSEEAGG